jgi:hypothetical protein
MALATPAWAATMVEVVAITDMGSGGRMPQNNDECHRCGKLGHWACECQSKARKDQAHIVQDEEASLMVVRATVTHCSSREALAAVETSREVEIGVVIHEERVFMQLGKPEPGRNAKILIIDSVATNHMTRSCTTFVELDTLVQVMVQFDNYSTAEIEDW